MVRAALIVSVVAEAACFDGPSPRVREPAPPVEWPEPAAGSGSGRAMPGDDAAAPAPPTSREYDVGATESDGAAPSAPSPDGGRWL